MGFATAEFTIATAVTSPSGTVAIGYPAGTVQADFITTNASATSYLLVNDNDRYEEADNEFDISFDSSVITLTNKTTSTWAIGDKITLNAANAAATSDVTFGPVANLAGSLTGTTDGTIDNIAATAAATAGGATPTAAQVDTGIATAVATIVTGTNTQLKELQVKLNEALGAMRAAGINLTS